MQFLRVVFDNTDDALAYLNTLGVYVEAVQDGKEIRVIFDDETEATEAYTECSYYSYISLHYYPSVSSSDAQHLFKAELWDRLP